MNNTKNRRWQKIILIVQVCAFFSCSTTNEHNFLDQEKNLIDRILLSHLSHFDTIRKDTLIVSLKPFIWCGNDNGIYVNGNSLYNKVRERAVKYGFSQVVLDTAKLMDIDQRSYRKFPHYALNISIYSKKGHIQQTYYYQRGPMVIESLKDTTVNL